MFFLNGVCRHELVMMVAGYFTFFLNGVCRHEQISPPKQRG
ncbi:hypothetical protein J635_0285 [Acinetobacter baumannii 233846]|nr:hypothetical protein J635_0285 [Acinetobacter baumannii 233846]